MQTDGRFAAAADRQGVRPNQKRKLLNPNMIKYLLKSDIFNFKLITPIKIGDITITPVKNIDSICDKIKRPGNHLKTCYASSYLYYENKRTPSEIQFSPKYNETMKKLDIICRLISFSQKCHVPYYGIYLYEKRRRISANHPATYFGEPTKFSHFKCDQSTLVHFINFSFNTISSKNEKEKNVILTSLWFYILSFNEKYQIGARLIELWIIFEMLVNFYSDKLKFTKILKPELFKPIHNGMKKVIDHYTKDDKNTKSDVEFKDALQQIREGIGNLNQQKIVNKAVLVLRYFAISATECDIRNISEIRNLVFHGGILTESEQNKTCVVERQLHFLLERLYLKIFNYNNKYSDSDWKDFHAQLFKFQKI